MKLLRTVGPLVILITIQLMSQYSDTTALPLIETVQVGGGNSRPVDVVAAPDGSLWFTDPGSERIGSNRFRPSDLFHPPRRRDFSPCRSYCLRPRGS